MKRIYLLRHGAAATEGVDRDEDRPLTQEGRSRLRLSASVWMKAAEPAPKAWIVSPYVRAVQTAELFVGAWASEAPVGITRALVPDGRVSVAADLVDENDAEVIALVGHQPLLGGLAAFLLGWPRVPAQLQPGAILAIDRPDDGPPTLAWHLVPPSHGEGPKLLRPEQKA